MILLILVHFPSGGDTGRLCALLKQSQFHGTKALENGPSFFPFLKVASVSE